MHWSTFDNTNTLKRKVKIIFIFFKYYSYFNYHISFFLLMIISKIRFYDLTVMYVDNLYLSINRLLNTGTNECKITNTSWRAVAGRAIYIQGEKVGSLLSTLNRLEVLVSFEEFVYFDYIIMSRLLVFLLTRILYNLLRLVSTFRAWWRRKGRSEIL